MIEKPRVGTCKLCDTAHPLLMSHILPKSFIRRMRGVAPQVIQLSFGSRNCVRKANGEYIERLLCQRCEAHIESNYERYGTRLFVEKKYIEENSENIFITHFDYQKYVLFIISILWRASVSSLKIYNSLSGFSALSELLKPTLLNNTLQIQESPALAIDDFIKISVKKVIDPTLAIQQESLDLMLFNLQHQGGNPSGEGKVYDMMMDGFYISITLFSYESSKRQGWAPPGRVLNRRYLKVPKVAYKAIPRVSEAIQIIQTTEHPFA